MTAIINCGVRVTSTVESRHSAVATDIAGQEGSVGYNGDPDLSTADGQRTWRRGLIAEVLRQRRLLRRLCGVVVHW